MGSMSSLWQNPKFLYVLYFQLLFLEAPHLSSLK